MRRTPTSPELQAQKSRAATRLLQQLVKHYGAIMNMTATPGNTPHVATRLAVFQKVSRHISRIAAPIQNIQGNSL
jgi:hypothetical protein